MATNLERRYLRITQRREPQLLSKVAFPFAYELVRLLEREGRSDLAKAVADLRVVEVVATRDPAEASFYVTPPRRVRWRGLGRRETLGLLAKHGRVDVDLIEGRIVLIKTRDRPDLAAALFAAGLHPRRHRTDVA
jgi:hypothetical protein